MRDFTLDERGRYRRGHAAARPCGGLRRLRFFAFFRAVYADVGLPAAGREGSHLGHLRGRTPRDALLRRGAAFGTREADGCGSTRSEGGHAMELGLLTAPFEDTPCLRFADWAGRHGFSAFEVACWPASGGEKKRRYAGTSHIDVDGLTKMQGEGDHRRAEGPRHLRLRAWLLPQPAPRRRSPPRGGDRPPEEGHHRRLDHGREGGEHVSSAATGSFTLDENWSAHTRSWAPS